MNISQLFQAVNGHFFKAGHSGQEFMWPIMPEARIRFIDFTNDAGKEIGNALVDKDGNILEITAQFTSTYDGCYRWNEAKFKSLIEEESHRRKIDNSIAWDDVHYTQIYSEEEILAILTDLVKGVQTFPLAPDFDPFSDSSAGSNTYTFGSNTGSDSFFAGFDPFADTHPVDEEEVDKIHFNIQEDAKKDFVFWSKIAGLANVSYGDLRHFIDTGCPLAVELSDEQFYGLAKIAEKRNLPLNDVINEALDKAIDQQK